jgi:hypothetical protein
MYVQIVLWVLGIFEAVSLLDGKEESLLCAFHFGLRVSNLLQLKSAMCCEHV